MIMSNYCRRWAFIIRKSQRSEVEEMLKNIDEQKYSPFVFEVDEPIRNETEPISIVRIRCTKDVIDQLCDELKSKGIEIL